VAATPTPYGALKLEVHGDTAILNCVAATPTPYGALKLRLLA